MSKKRAKKEIARISDWKELFWPCLGSGIMGYSAKKTVALFLDRTRKPMLELMRRRFDDIIRILVEFKTRERFQLMARTLGSLYQAARELLPRDSIK
jgi:hypothetical protein